MCQEVYTILRAVYQKVCAILRQCAKKFYTILCAMYQKVDTILRAM